MNNPLYKVAVEFAAKWEGGYVNHPRDPGGATNYGVTQASYNEFRSSKGQVIQDVRAISKSELNDIYLRYWNAANCDKCAGVLSVAQFDTSFNFGPVGASRFMQELLGVSVDGAVGPITLGALAKANHDALAYAYPYSRIAYRYQRVHEAASQRVFLQGWLNRDRDLLSLVRKHI